jgi:hypothetical protein
VARKPTPKEFWRWWAQTPEEFEQYEQCLATLRATPRGREALASIKKQARKPRRHGGGMPKRVVDNDIGPLMMYVADLAEQSGLPKTTVLATLVDALPAELRNKKAERKSSDWRRIYNKRRRGDLPELLPEIKKAISVRVTKGYPDPALDIVRQRILSLLRAR